MPDTASSGTILSLPEGRALVRLAGQPACGACPGEGEGCDFLGPEECPVKVLADNPEGLRPGALVALRLVRPEDQARAAAIVFGIPLAGILGGGLLGLLAWAGAPELGALAGMGLGLLAALPLSAWAGRAVVLRPRVIPLSEVPSAPS